MVSDKIKKIICIHSILTNPCILHGKIVAFFCENLANTRNGTITFTNGLRLGSIATLRCNEGYVPGASVSRTCEADGWSNYDLICQGWYLVNMVISISHVWADIIIMSKQSSPTDA